MPTPAADTTHWVHDLNPVLLPLWGEFGIRYYGLAYLAGFAVAYFGMRAYLRRGLLPLTHEQLERVTFAGVLGLLIGARLGFFFLYDLERVASNPASLLRVWEGGMSFHGGLVGAMIGVWWASRKANASFLLVGELVTTVAPAGILFGRLANFINGELYGRVTSVPWAVIFPSSAMPGTPVEQIPPRHPSQLYEAALEGAVLLAYMQWRVRFTDAATRPGRLAGEFLVLYAVFRIFCEFFREPDASLILGLSRGMAYSTVMVFAGVGLWLHSVRAERRVIPAGPVAAEAATPQKPRAKGKKRK